VRASDLDRVPAQLVIDARITAGQPAPGALAAGKTMAIMTGAMLPAGADAVVPIEDTRVQGACVHFTHSITSGRFIARAGSEARAGDVALAAGARLEAPQIAVAASVGAAVVPVWAAPSVAVLGTGDELVQIDQKPLAAQIRSSNNAMLTALLAKYHCNARDLGIVRDDVGLLRQAIVDGLGHDVLLVSGGMSMGERDYVPGILRELGGKMKITKLRIKPGKPFIFAHMPGGKFVFGLPGNPLSAFVCTVCLVRRLLERMSGGKPDDSRRPAPLAAALEPNGPREFYQPAIFDGRSITPLFWKGSADIFTLARANSLIIRAENQPAQAAGAIIDFLEL
jgi:molybdopterin molybdotransferase